MAARRSGWSGCPPPDERLAHRTATIPLPDAFFTWAQVAERKLSPRSELAQALRYIIKRRTALTRRPPRSGQQHRRKCDQELALGRRNWLFAGSHSGGERAAATYSILQTAKLNGINPEAYLTDTFFRIAAGHPISRISELMPWAFQSPLRDPAA
jgi:transposase